MAGAWSKLTAPQTGYLGLHTSGPWRQSTYNAGPGLADLPTLANELAGSGYTRTAATTWTRRNFPHYQGWTTPPVGFPAATAAWAAVSSFGIWTAPTGGALVYGAQLEAPLVVRSNDGLVLLPLNLADGWASLLPGVGWPGVGWPGGILDPFDPNDGSKKSVTLTGGLPLAFFAPFNLGATFAFPAAHADALVAAGLAVYAP